MLVANVLCEQEILSPHSLTHWAQDQKLKSWVDIFAMDPHVTGRKGN